jgi:hypothetical protein
MMICLRTSESSGCRARELRVSGLATERHTAGGQCLSNDVEQRLCGERLPENLPGAEQPGGAEKVIQPQGASARTSGSAASPAPRHALP